MDSYSLLERTTNKEARVSETALLSIYLMKQLEAIERKEVARA